MSLDHITGLREYRTQTICCRYEGSTWEICFKACWSEYANINPTSSFRSRTRAGASGFYLIAYPNFFHFLLLSTWEICYRTLGHLAKGGWSSTLEIFKGSNQNNGVSYRKSDPANDLQTSIKRYAGVIIKLEWYLNPNIKENYNFHGTANFWASKMHAGASMRSKISTTKSSLPRMSSELLFGPKSKGKEWLLTCRKNMHIALSPFPFHHNAQV